MQRLTRLPLPLRADAEHVRLLVELPDRLADAVSRVPNPVGERLPHPHWHADADAVARV
jgi:hypothetical protein